VRGRRGSTRPGATGERERVEIEDFGVGIGRADDFAAFDAFGGLRGASSPEGWGGSTICKLNCYNNTTCRLRDSRSICFWYSRSRETYSERSMKRQTA
jgi:hypothetical protein